MENQKTLTGEFKDKDVGKPSSRSKTNGRFESFKNSLGSLGGQPRPEILPFGEINQKINESKISNTLLSTYHKITRGTTMIKESQEYRVRGINGVSTTLQGLSGGIGAKTGLYAIEKNCSYCHRRTLQYIYEDGEIICDICHVPQKTIPKVKLENEKW